LDHPNIIRLYEVVEDSRAIVLVTEYAELGDLLRYVRARQRLQDPEARDFARQLVDGVEYLHGKQIVHRDIKPENLLIDARRFLKIADFGVSVNAGGKPFTEHCGTPSYIAPEILDRGSGGYDGEPVDVWCVGVVLYAMLCGRVPFKGDTVADLKKNIIRGKFTIPSVVSEKASALLRGTLVDVKKRFTLDRVSSDSWLEGTPNRAVEHRKAKLEYHPQAADEVVNCGFSSEYLERSLAQRELNGATATYEIVKKYSLTDRKSK
jgi:serine/threonine protein kinase